MSRTRIVFLIVLAIVLTLVAVSLAIEWVSTTAARQLFIAATVFSVGVVGLDLLGVLGGHQGDAGHDFDGAPDAVSVESGDAMAAHLDVGDDGGAGDGYADSDLDAGHGDAADADAAGHHPVHDAHPPSPVLSVLTYLRLMVYFCLGFGPTGWVSMAAGRSALVSLGWAVLVGLGALFLAQAFFRFQRRDTDSQLAPTELVSQPATVLVPLDHRTMGKVRVRVGMNVVDHYARAADESGSFEKGDQVWVTQVTDECLYVR